MEWYEKNRNVILIIFACYLAFRLITMIISQMRFYTILLITSTLTYSQINPKNIDIVRDQYGIPHIFAKTDAELSYGLAWANAEDDFNTIQEAYLAGNAMLSRHIGLKGAPADFITQFIGSKELIDEKIGEISNDYLKVISAYAQGLNLSLIHI